MKFLFVSNFTEDLNSGAAGSLISLGSALIELGHEVDYLWRERESKIKHENLSNVFELPDRQLRLVDRRLQEKSYDVVSVSQPFAYLVYELLREKYSNTIFLNRTHGWEARVIQAEKKYGWQGERRGLSKWMSAWMQYQVKRCCERTALKADGIVTLSKRCRDFIESEYRINPKKIAIVPHGLDESFLTLPQRQRWNKDMIRLLYVGNYLPIKGSKIMEKSLPQIAKKFPNVSLTMIVQEEMHDYVKQFYEASFGERLKVTAWQSRNKLIDVYSAHDIFLFPSLFEGFSKTALEAMACGMCLVGFEEGFMGEEIEEKKAAIFRAAGDAATFQALLDHTLKHKECISESGKNAQVLARDYSWDLAAKRWVEFVETLKGMKER